MILGRRNIALWTGLLRYAVLLCEHFVLQFHNIQIFHIQQLKAAGRSGVSSDIRAMR